MPTWQEVKNKVVAFRNYVAGLTPTARASAKYAFMITKQDIKDMIEQAGGVPELDGIRAYLGADIIDGEMVPRIYFVAVKKEMNEYNDYDLGKTVPTGSTPLVKEGLPCPTWCSKSNFLNS
jgi:hypothetical protein